MKLIRQLKEIVLDRAIAGDHNKLLKFVMKYVFKVNLTDYFKATSFPKSTEKGFTLAEIIELLLNSKANVFSIVDRNNLVKALYFASEKNYTDVVALLLRYEADDDNLLKIQNLQSLLHFVSEKGYTDIVELLLRHGVDVNATGLSGSEATPLLLASENGYCDTVELLLKYRADVNVTIGVFNETLLHIVVEKGYFEIVELLLKHGADVNAITYNYSETPLHFAARKGDFQIVDLLLKHGADVNAITYNYCETPLHFAAKKGDFQIVELLLKHGADINLRQYCASTALDLAVKQGHIVTSMILIIATLWRNPSQEKNSNVQSNERLSSFWNQVDNDFKQINNYFYNKGISISFNELHFNQNNAQLMESLTLKTLNDLTQAAIAAQHFDGISSFFVKFFKQMESSIEKKVNYFSLLDKLNLLSNPGRIALNSDVKHELFYNYLPVRDLKSLLSASLFPPVNPSNSKNFDQNILTVSSSP
ncbi:ankyrin repeat domain-containing protein [Rickettsiella massiliensis]|uniref:ankyrin repeat domain-containing protein n=1 Tax=Rickettsiella massiliensis TaxID=676517 RepID=UPI00029A8FDC|nr:ankyrin repeat domain-containing protein [Rickettsiella massiliensis]